MSKKRKSQSKLIDFSFHQFAVFALIIAIAMFICGSLASANTPPANSVEVPGGGGTDISDPIGVDRISGGFNNEFLGDPFDEVFQESIDTPSDFEITTEIPIIPGNFLPGPAPVNMGSGGGGFDEIQEPVITPANSDHDVVADELQGLVVLS